VAGPNGPGQNGDTTPEPATYPGYRFPAEIIQHAIWLHHLFSLSLRNIELILAERGVVVSYESTRRRCLCFVRTLPPSCASGDQGRATPGTWMRCT